MKSILRRRPSPALVIACLALFLSLGGVSYGLATGSIDSREIKNNTVASGDVRNNTLRTFDIRNNAVRGFDIRNSTVQGRDVALNTLTGADISEASLAKVPSATNADSAATATTVASLKTIAPTTVAEAGSGPATLVTHGSLTLTGACTPTPGAEAAAQVRVQVTEPGAAAGTIDVPGIDPSSGAVTIAALPMDVVGVPVVDSVPIFARAGTKAVTGTLGLEVSGAGAGSDSCRFSGHLVLSG